MNQPKVTSEAMQAVENFLRDVHVAPRNNGGVQLEWSTEDGFELEVYFGPDGKIEGGFVAIRGDHDHQD